MDPQPVAHAILDLPVDPSNGSGATTIRGYLFALLATVWDETSDFSGKRPFGSSYWPYDLYKPLMKAGYITGTFNGDGDLDEADYRTGDRLIADAIKALGKAPAAPKLGDLVAGDAGNELGWIVGTLVENSWLNGMDKAAIQVRPDDRMPYAAEPTTLHVLKAGEAR